MSSLAGALVPPSHAPLPPDPLLPPAPDSLTPEDVQMQAPPITDDGEDEEMTDLFGNDNDVEDAKADDGPASPDPSGQDSDRLLSPERERRQALEYEEDELPGHVAVVVHEANVAFPNIPVPKSSDGDNWVIRMPNFVKVDSKPYHPDTYMGPEHEDEESQQAETLREKSMTIKLKVENTLRWRWVKDESGQDRRQSNSRVIRWSDGSLSLRLGKELFDINQSIDTSGGIPRQVYGGPQASQSQSQPPDVPPQSLSQSQSQSQTGPKSQGLTYLVAQHKHAQVLQSEALVTGFMTLRPTGMQSETHQMLVRAVGQKHNRVARLRMAPDPTMDPEKEKMELMKLTAKKSKKKADTEDGFGGARKRRYSKKRSGDDIWSEDEDEDGRGFAASEGEDDERGGSGSRRKIRSMGNGDDKKGSGEYQEDDFVVADSSEEEAGSDGDGKGKRRKADDEMEEDPLDKLDAKIMEQQDAKKRRRESGGKGARDSDTDAESDEAKKGDEEMDAESEEEEEEFKVRRVGGAGARRKRAIDVHEDEEDE